MSSPFFRLSKNTLIYGSGQIVSRAITFVMLPWTTRYLTPEDYGIIGILGILAYSLFGLFTLGFGISLPREYGGAEKHEEKAAVIWSGFGALFLNIAFWVILGSLFSQQLSLLVLNSTDYSLFIILTLINGALGNLQLPFLTYFKIKERAFFVVSLTIAELVLNISLTIYWVFYCGMGCYGVILAGVAGQMVTLLLFAAAALQVLPLRFSLAAVKEMVRVGYPYIVGVAGTFLMQFSARYILQLLSNRDEVGLFFMSSNFSKIAEFVMTAFISAWAPFSITYVNKREEASTLFGRILSHYSLGMSLLLLLFFVVARPVVELMVQPPYYSVWPLVGIMATTYGLLGLYSIVGSGFIFDKRSAMQVAVEVSAGAACIAFSFLLIPFAGKMGAAVSTLMGYAMLVGLAIFFNRGQMAIRFEKRRLLNIAAGFSVAVLLTYMPIASLLGYSLFTGAVFLAYCFFLYAYCMTESERGKLSWRTKAVVSS